MPGDAIPPPTHRAYGITNIKSYVPIILDLTTHNYNPWSDLFKAHCITYDVLDHIDDTYDPPKSPPTDPEWEKLDSMVKLWLFGTISQSLITSAYSSKATARKVWLNIQSLFCENTESTAMQLENDLRNISMGDLSVHDYCDKIKKIADLLEGLGEKVKEKHVVTHALNGLSRKFDGVANIIRFSKPFPSFSEMRCMLLMTETQLSTTRVPQPIHDNHTSSPSLLHVASSSSNRGGGNSHRRHDRRGSHNNNRRRQPPTYSAGQPAPNNRYGWVYIPPPAPQSATQWASSPPFSTPQWAVSQPLQQQPSLWSRPAPINQQGLLGSRPNSSQQQHSFGPQAHHVSAPEQPPWAWLGNMDQPTSLPQMFNTMSLQDPGSNGWVMDSAATDHVHTQSDTPPTNPL